MRQSPFIWLGSGRTRKRKVGHKGRLLDQAAKSGLPVPFGGILLDEFYRICLLEGLAGLVGGAVVIPDPVWLHEVLYRDVRFPRLKKFAAVRSAVAIPASESRTISIARLDVDFRDPAQVAEALREVWSAMHRLNNEQPLDVLVMEMVAIQTAGEAISALDSTNDQINVTKGADSELYGSFTLEKIGAFQRASVNMPPFARRLQKLLRGVRRSFGKGDWRIDWADDGEICRLLQIY